MRGSDKKNINSAANGRDWPQRRVRDPAAEASAYDNRSSGANLPLRRYKFRPSQGRFDLAQKSKPKSVLKYASE
jgi:hypothetical protein